MVLQLERRGALSVQHWMQFRITPGETHMLFFRIH